MDKQREAFEAWAQSENMSIAWGVTNYLFSETAKAWKAWQHLSHAEGEAPNTYWVLFDATSDKKHIKKLADDGSLLFYDTEDEAMHARRLYPGTDYQRVEYYTHPAPQVAVPEGWRVRKVSSGEPRNGFVIGTPPENGVRTNTSIWLDDEDPAHQMLALMLSAPTAPAGEPDDSDICEQVELPHVLAWADGIRGDMWTEYADRITDEEARVAQAVWAAHTGEQPVSDPDGLLTRAADLLRCLSSVGYDFQYDDNGICCGSVSADWAEINSVAEALEKIATPAPDEREIAARALDEFRTGPLRSACLSYGWDTESDAYIVDRMLDEEASLLRAGKEGQGHA